MTQTVPDILPLMPMHQDPLLVGIFFPFLKAVETTSTKAAYAHLVLGIYLFCIFSGNCVPPSFVTLSSEIARRAWGITNVWNLSHYNDVIMSVMTSQITSLTIVYSSVYSDADQRKHQSSASLAFVRGIHRWPVNSPRKWPVTRKMFPFDDVIM